MSNVDTSSVYNGFDCIAAVSISTCCWFFISHVILTERIVLSFFPELIRSTLLKEAKSARIRLEQHPILNDVYSNDTSQSASQSCQKNSRRKRGNLWDQQNAEPRLSYHVDRQYLSQLQNRSAGVFNSVISVVLAIWCTLLDPSLINNRIFGVSFSWLFTGAYISGYFIWDLIVIISNYKASPDNWQWLLHGIICFGALSSPFFAQFAPMSYYAALFLYLEASSIFMGVRWYCLKTMQILKSRSSKKNTADILYLKRISERSSTIFAIAFFIVRIIFAPLAIFIPLLKIFFLDPSAKKFSIIRWWMYVTFIPVFFLLNIFWMVKIVEAAWRTRTSKMQ